MLLELDRPISIWFDADEAGDRGWDKAQKLIGDVAFSLKRLRPPEGVDVGKMTEGHFRIGFDRLRTIIG